MEGPPLGPGGQDITWPDQVAPWGRKASSTRKIKPQTSNLVSHLLCADHIISSFIHAWPAPFNRIASVWWLSCTHLEDKRNFAKMLVPSSLYEAMSTPAHGGSKPQRVLAFKTTLPQRQRKRKDALSDALTWLAEDPPPRPQPPPRT